MDIERQNFLKECQAEIDKKVLDGIISRKRKGIDCTEAESAELKQRLKYDKIVTDEIKILFPIEYSEAVEELKAELIERMGKCLELHKEIWPEK